MNSYFSQGWPNQQRWCCLAEGFTMIHWKIHHDPLGNPQSVRRSDLNHSKSKTQVPDIYCRCSISLQGVPPNWCWNWCDCVYHPRYVFRMYSGGTTLRTLCQSGFNGLMQFLQSPGTSKRVCWITWCCSQNGKTCEAYQHQAHFQCCVWSCGSWTLCLKLVDWGIIVGLVWTCLWSFLIVSRRDFGLYFQRCYPKAEPRSETWRHIVRHGRLRAAQYCFSCLGASWNSCESCFLDFDALKIDRVSPRVSLLPNTSWNSWNSFEDLYLQISFAHIVIRNDKIVESHQHKTRTTTRRRRVIIFPSSLHVWSNSCS